MLHWFRTRTQRNAKALELYGSSVAQARQPVFYRAWCVADTLDGRFELVMLHVALLLRRLTDEGEAGKALGRSVVEQMFAALDDDMREIGVGDLTVPKRMHKAASAFYGRLKVYDDALKADNDESLRDAMARNMPAGEAAKVANTPLAAYVRTVAASLDSQAFASLAQGHVTYPHPDGARP